MTTATGRKLYSVDSANQALPLVRVIVQDIVELARELADRRERLRAATRAHGKPRPSDEPSLYQEEIEQAEDELAKDENRLSAFEAELEALGVELTNRVLGQVEFHAVQAGRAVRLCWTLGEQRVEHWREANENPKRRRPLSAFG